jgi:hypothetical protein
MNDDSCTPYQTEDKVSLIFILVIHLVHQHEEEEGRHLRQLN